MRTWSFAAKHGLLVHIKLVLLLSTSMVGSLIMASTLLHAGFFPVFSSFHLSKTVPGLSMGLNLAILERVLDGNLSIPVQRRPMNRSLLFLKSFFVILQPVFLSNKE